ncbi:MAG: BT4734/BF3469 family protein, partial [Bacteroidia bacterium]
MKVSIYKNVKDTTGGKSTVFDLLEGIRDGRWKTEIEKLRTIADKEKFNQEKTKLPGVTWSGTFTTRHADKLETYSGLICLDVDKLPEGMTLEDFEQILDNDKYVYTYFVSPSGHGMKILIRLSTEVKFHKEAFIALEHHFLKHYNVEIDKSGKDVNRLCFVSHYPQLIMCEEAKPYDFFFVIFEKCVEFTNKKTEYNEGNRNNYLFLLANNCNRIGLPEEKCRLYFVHTFTDMKTDELNKVIKSAYKAAGEHGKYKPEQLDIPDKEEKHLNENGQDKQPTTKVEYGLFWKTFTNKKTGEQGQAVIYAKLQEFLEKNGFGRLFVSETVYQFVRVTNKVVKIVNELTMKDFVLDWLQEQEEHEIYELMVRGCTRYFSTPILERVKPVSIDFKKDTAHECFLFFKNCFVRITQDGVESIAYDKLDKNVWATQIIEHDFTYQQMTHGSDFHEFMKLVCYGKKEPKELTTEDGDKLLSMSTSIGYLMHRYKNPALAKAVVSVDARISRKHEMNGGTGKSIIGKALSKLRKVCTVEAQNFKFEKAFPFQQVTLDTDIINFNDANDKFEFVKLFGMITDDFTVEKKRLDAFTIPFDDSPKIYISTNFTLRGDGNSFDRRQQIIEFSEFFNKQNTPDKHFKHLFFNDWDAVQYNLFFSTMVNCAKSFLTNGLLPFPASNYEIRKLQDS